MIVRKIVKTEVDVEGLGARLKAAQRDSPKNIEQLVRELDISRTYWNSLINETAAGISIEMLRKIEAALGVDFGVTFD
jgi:transcriptional regulator with XRE-family HTH domain